MKVTPRNYVRRYQMGGPMGPEEVPAEGVPGGGAPGEGVPAEEPGMAPEGGGEQDPIMMLAQMSAQALQGQDCQLAMQVCQAFLEIIQQMQGGGAPAEEPQGEPVFRRGGVLVRRIKK